MIKTWKTSATRQLAETGKSKFSGLDVDKALERLTLLNAAVTLKQITPLKSVGLHALKGDRKGLWAMTINVPWRLCFRFKDGDAYDVEIVDYH
ncbi:MAG: type II toxin-antitoxin system RelE/ParE family toxin [Rhodospirillales bacterium]|nr:type II toxin-antitoxin system RelE/ParE family toxin [Rhodospirillales bacterium]